MEVQQHYFGSCRGGIPGDKTKYSIGLSFIKHKAKGLFYNEFTTLFYQKNNADEPGIMGRVERV